MENSGSRMLLETGRYQGGSDGRLLMADAFFEILTRCFEKRPNCSRTTTKHAIPAPTCCILRTSASLKSLRKHYKTQKRAEDRSETTSKAPFQTKAHEEIFLAPTPSSKKRKFRTILPRVDTCSCTHVLRMPRLPHPTTLLQNRSKTTTQRTKTHDNARRPAACAPNRYQYEAYFGYMIL